MLLQIFLLLVLVLFVRFIYQFRFEFMYFALFILTTVQGHKFRIARSHKDIKYAMQFSDKGSVVEELLATPAWLPILSIESVNHSLWQSLKKNFLIFLKELPPKSELGKIADFEVRKYLSADGNRMNSKEITKLTLKIFTDWIFKDTTFENDSALTGLTDDMIERIYEASTEYRKEIAIKGKGCMKKKQEAVDIMVNLLSQNSKFKRVFNGDWSHPENYSVVLQPFIISPMINVADIAVTVDRQRLAYEKNDRDIDLFIDYCIQSAHPFPILERFDAAKNTQIFIDPNSMAEDQKSFAFNYSAGPRACLGRHLAREFLASFFKPIIESESVDFRPTELHKYSGRNNDIGSLAESVYQLKLFFKLTFSLAKKRFSSKDKLE